MHHWLNVQEANPASRQTGVYGDDIDPASALKNDFHNVPIVSFCKETATFPLSTFDTENNDTINTYFSYAGYQDK